jgi:putative oxidoreductase
MDFLILLGRVALAAMFIYAGYGKFADLAGTAAYIASKNLPMPQVLAVAAGATELLGGALVVLGWQTRLAAILLFLFTAASAYLFHDFWHLPEGAERADQMIHAMKNLSIMGGFLILAGAGAGSLSVDGTARSRL